MIISCQPPVGDMDISLLLNPKESSPSLSLKSRGSKSAAPEITLHGASKNHGSFHVDHFKVPLALGCEGNRFHLRSISSLSRVVRISVNQLDQMPHVAAVRMTLYRVGFSGYEGPTDFVLTREGRTAKGSYQHVLPLSEDSTSVHLYLHPNRHTCKSTNEHHLLVEFMDDCGQSLTGLAVLMVGLFRGPKNRKLVPSQCDSCTALHYTRSESKWMVSASGS